MSYQTMLRLIAVCFLAAACTKNSEEPPKPKLSEIFKSQFVQYLKDAGKLSMQSSDGITATTLARQLTEAKATFDLLEQTWPPGFAVGAREEFGKAHQGYMLALLLWQAKLKNLDNPTEPDINNWAAYQRYAGEALRTKVWDGIVPEYKGRTYLPFDENISILLTLGSAHFEKGRATALKELP